MYTIAWAAIREDLGYLHIPRSKANSAFVDHVGGKPVLDKCMSAWARARHNNMILFPKPTLDNDLVFRRFAVSGTLHTFHSRRLHVVNQTKTVSFPEIWIDAVRWSAQVSKKPVCTFCTISSEQTLFDNAGLARACEFRRLNMLWTAD
jgi:hypothetical protein